jgi:beta-glucanase (GH16 family)
LGEFVEFNPVDWAATHEDSNNPVDNTPTSYAGYTQVWADEFNGNAVNPFNWKYDIGTGDNGWGNGELQYYRPENASVEDGLLIIEAKKHQPVIQIANKDAKYTSSKLKSEGLFEFKYGRVDIRAVVAKGQGMWSAGWMLGTNHSQIGWPYSGEIDIFDTIGGVKNDIPQEDMIVNNMYWNGTGSNPDTSAYAPVNIALNGSGEVRIDPDNPSNDGVTFSNKFHTFSLVWDEDKIEFQLDGVTTKEIDLPDGSALADTYRNPFYLILNVAVGGAWPGAPDETTEFPDGMLVDYVRVYQTDSDGDGIADFELDGETPLDQD